MDIGLSADAEKGTVSAGGQGVSTLFICSEIWQKQARYYREMDDCLSWIARDDENTESVSASKANDRTRLSKSSNDRTLMKTVMRACVFAAKSHFKLPDDYGGSCRIALLQWARPRLERIILIL